MPSLLTDFEYDIFISYRQNDNQPTPSYGWQSKGDGWVSEFVTNLNKELEATIKDKVTVYFDANPHDGLLETHSVDRSLEDKLRCLIFIPILSRTYCDPKSYAWDNEFLAFLNSAGEDSIGLNVKLNSGNVASRVLPIRIHDLNPEDVSLVESQIGVIRSIDFIYKSSGVNRPLRANEDHPQDNLNKTYYRDQINKVANAIDEIIRGLKKEQDTSDKRKSSNGTPDLKVRKEEKRKGLVEKISIKPKSKQFTIIILSLFICAVGAAIIYRIINYSKHTQQPSYIEKSIAVLPFANDSPDASNQHFVDGTMETILDNLCKIADFKVVSRTSVEQFRNSTRSIPEIAKKLGVNYVLEGSGQKYENNIRLTVQLIDAITDKHIWSRTYDRAWKDFFLMQSEIAGSVAVELKAIMTPEEKQRIEKAPTKNLEAYNLYLLGRSYISQNSEKNLEDGIRCFKNAIQLDSTFALAYVGLSQCYQFMVRYSWMSRAEGYQEAKKTVMKALQLDESSGEAHATLGLIMIVFDWDIYGPEQEFQQAIKLSPNSAEVYSSYAQYLRWIGRYDEGMVIAKRAAELDPLTTITNFWLGAIYFYEGNYDESINYFKNLLTLDSTYVSTYAYLAYNFTLKGSYSNAIFYADKALSLIDIKKGSLQLCGLIWVYAKSGEVKKARELFSQVNQTNEDPVRMAIVYTGLGDYEKAFDYLSKAYEIRSGQLIYLVSISDSWLKELSLDPRYKDLLKKIGFRNN